MGHLDQNTLDAPYISLRLDGRPLCLCAASIGDRWIDRLEFVEDGRTLLIGGMGYLAAYSISDNAFAELHKIETAVSN